MEDETQRVANHSTGRKRRMNGRTLVALLAAALAGALLGAGITFTVEQQRASNAEERLETYADENEEQREVIESYEAQEKEIADAEEALRDQLDDVTAREDELATQERAAKASTVEGDGLFEVGEDIKAGQYKTPGGTFNCYYAILGSSNTSDILDNNNVEGPAIVTLRAGQYFQTSGCEQWKRQ